MSQDKETLSELAVIFAATLVVTFHIAYVVHATLIVWLVASCALFVFLRARPTRFDLVALGLAAAITGVLAASTYAPPGVDGAMHSAVARLIALADGHPTSFRPLWPLDRFDTYPVGQPSLTALWHLLFSPRVAALIGHATSYGLTTLALTAAMLRASGVALTWWSFSLSWLAFFACRSPLQYWTWGGAPNALGLGFTALAFSFGITLWRRGSVRTMFSCGVLAAAALLTHGISFVTAIYLALVLTLAQCARERSLAALPRLALAGVIGVGCLIPYLARFHWALSQDEAAWVARTSRTTLEQLHGLQLIPRTLHDMALIATVVAAAWLALKAKEQLVLPLLSVLVLLGLILNGYVSALPMSATLYPDRIAACLAPVCGIIWLLTLPHAPKRAVAVFIAIMCVPAASLTWRSVESGQEHTLLTAKDMALITALEASVPTGCAVIANYGDAGQWLPALSSHPASYPQVNVVFFDEVAEDTTPCAAFVGERRVYGDDSVTEQCQRVGCVDSGGWFRLQNPAPIRIIGAR